jgi:anti-anti-sigma factor
LRIVGLREFITCACDVPTALQIIDSRTREAIAAVTRRTAAASNPITWQGEITAANAEAVWKFTREHINLLCAGWKAGGSDRNGNNNLHSQENGGGRIQNGTGNGLGQAHPAVNTGANGYGHGGRESDTSLLARADAEPHPVLDALKLRILNPPAIVRQRKVTIDLSNVRFIDSTGLGLMVRAKKLVASHGAQLSFSGLQPTVRNVVRIAKMEEYLLSDAVA